MAAQLFFSNRFFLGIRHCHTQSVPIHQFVPRHESPQSHHVDRLQSFLRNSHRLLILTGAGISTESGIPDYRSEDVGRFARTNHLPITIQEFLKNPSARQRHWARNYVGWPGFSSFHPNSNHKSLAKWESTGRILRLITQNVDSLHIKAGSRHVTELHGTAFRVRCLNCHQMYTRHEVQDLIKSLNPSWAGHSQGIAPDGDVDLTAEEEKSFREPKCVHCTVGILQPDVVFFGDNVPRKTMDTVNESIELCDSLLVIGSSLQVYSGLKIINNCQKDGKPICIVNIGPTRGDNLADVLINTKCGSVLPQIDFQ